MQVDSIKILTRSEIAEIVLDLKRKKRSINTRQNLAIFRLATCAGLRVSEIVGLTLSNVKVNSTKPHIFVSKAIGKGKKSRKVPLWWDAGTLADLQAWKAEREEQGATGTDPFVCSQSAGTVGKKLSVRNCQHRFKSMIRCLGEERQEDLSIHSGRHSFVSHALAGGRTLAEVRDAAGHANISTTSVYLHVASEDSGQVGDLFNFPMQ